MALEGKTELGFYVIYWQLELTGVGKKQSFYYQNEWKAKTI